MAFTKVAVIGAGGSLGRLLVNHLVESNSPKFQTTVFARPSSNYTAPSDSVSVVKLDLLDRAGLTEALKSHSIEAVVMVQGVDQHFLPTSKSVIEAAIDAGVKMVMPSDYGSEDTPTFVAYNPAKPEIKEYVEEKAKEGKITYTLIKNGAFLDMPIELVLRINPKDKTVQLFDDGDQKFYMTSMDSVALAIVGVLRSPAQFSNKLIHVHDILTTQLEVLSIVEVETGGEKFKRSTVSTEELGRKSIEGLKSDQRNMENIFGAIAAAVWGKEAAGYWDPNDETHAVGLPGKDLKEEIKKKLSAAH